MKYIPFYNPKRYILIELCACRNMIVHHQKMELFFAFLSMNCTEQHTTGLNTHHRSWRKISNSDTGLSNQFFRLIICVDAA